MPSGSTLLSRQTLTSNPSRFAYAGDSHVYIFDAKTYKLEKILPFCEASVTHIAFHPLNPNVIACILMDNSFEVWDVDKESRLINMDLEKSISSIDWNCNDTNLIAFVLKQSKNYSKNSLVI